MVPNLFETTQDDNLKGEVSSVDVSTEENMKNLAKVAENLLNKPISRVNLETGNYEPSGDLETNAQALIRYKIASNSISFLASINTSSNKLTNMALAGMPSCCLRKNADVKRHRCKSLTHNQFTFFIYICSQKFVLK